MSADTALRANVRLLGDLLGRVLVEQEGQELLDDEERIRALARDARAGGSREPLGEAVAALGHDRQAAVLRAFALFFQLVNIAEQHHRIRRRREYEAEGRVPRESLAEAFAQLDQRRRRGRCAPGGRRAPPRRARPDGTPDRGDTSNRPRGPPSRCSSPGAARRRRDAGLRAAARRGTSSRRRSRCSGRRTRSDPSGRGSWTRSGRDSGSSSRASGTRFPTSSGLSVIGSPQPARRCGSEPGSAETSTAIPTSGPRRSRMLSSAPGSSHASCTAVS